MPDNSFSSPSFSNDEANYRALVLLKAFNGLTVSQAQQVLDQACQCMHGLTMIQCESNLFQQALSVFATVTGKSGSSPRSDHRPAARNPTMKEEALLVAAHGAAFEATKGTNPETLSAMSRHRRAPMNSEEPFDLTADERNMAQLRQVANACVERSVDWYQPEDLCLILSAWVEPPELVDDVVFVSLATPQRVQALMIEIETLRGRRSTDPSVEASS